MKSVDFKRNALRESSFLVNIDIQKRKCREQIGLETLVVYTLNNVCLFFFHFLKNLKYKLTQKHTT